MTTIFIYGDKGDAAFKNLIIERLSRTYKIIYVFGGIYIEKGSGYELLFVEMSSPSQIICDSGIVLLKAGAALPCRIFSNKSIVIANAQNIEQVSSLKNHKGNVITCGLCKKDTFSCTSNTAESLVISLNRSITALSGRKIEPLEIPVQQENCDTYSLIAFTALRAVLDDFNSEIGKLY